VVKTHLLPLPSKCMVYDRSVGGIMKSVKRNIISIDANGMGSYAEWRIILELRGLAKGYSVWVFEDNNVEERVCWKKIDESSNALSWREACRYLTEDSRYWVTTDKWQDVSVYGVPEWTVFLFKFIYILDEINPSHKFRDIAQLILQFNDEDIREISKYLSSYDPDSTDEMTCDIMEALDQVITDLEEDDLSKYSSMKHLFECYGMLGANNLVEFAQKLLYEDEDDTEDNSFQSPPYRDIVLRVTADIDKEVQILKDWFQAIDINHFLMRMPSVHEFQNMLIDHPDRIVPLLWEIDTNSCATVINAVEEITEVYRLRVNHKGRHPYWSGVIKPRYQKIVDWGEKVLHIYETLTQQED